MGIIKRGILGGYSNKVGNVVGSSWKGIATMRVLPLSVANPRTAAQVENRDAFKSITLFASSILTSIVKPLNDRFALRMSGFNLFVQRNKSAFANPLSVDWASITLSRGRLSQPQITGVTNSSPGVNEITWDTALSGSMDMATDKAYLLIVGDNGEVTYTSSGEYPRSAGEITITGLQGSDVKHVFLSFLRADGTEVSPSTYLEV